uniref:Uncharacterized protein n=1 Tax=Oryza brachyantha TaxID=4533 RepID=J3MLX4_ORYBR
MHRGLIAAVHLRTNRLRFLRSPCAGSMPPDHVCLSSSSVATRDAFPLDQNGVADREAGSRRGKKADASLLSTTTTTILASSASAPAKTTPPAAAGGSLR